MQLARSGLRQTEAPWQYTRNLIHAFYSLLGEGDLADYIQSRYEGYATSRITRRWLPYCLASVRGAMAFDALNAAGLFERAPFRDATTDAPVGGMGSEAIAQKVTEGKVVPSLDVFLWALAVAGVAHYGNDRDFFARLAKLRGLPLSRRFSSLHSGKIVCASSSSVRTVLSWSTSMAPEKSVCHRERRIHRS